MRNASSTIDKCLSSISDQTMKNCEVILVDDSSDDDTVEKAKKYPAKIIELNNCVRPSKARNLGAKIATGDILVFLDADILLQPDSIEKIITSLRSSDASIICGVYTENIPEANYFTQLQNFILVYRYSEALVHDNYSNSYFCALKKEVFEDVGGYNEKMYYYEDMEIGHRFEQKGYLSRLDTNLKVTHLKYYSHVSLLTDYFKKTAVAGAYKLNNFANNFKADGLPLSFKLSGASTVFLLFSLAAIKITPSLPLLFLVLYSVSIMPFMCFLVKKHNFFFGIKSYVVCFEIFMVSALALIYGILAGNKND